MSDTPSPSLRKLARRLLELSQSASDSHVHEAQLMCTRLGISLTKFAGAAGFASLLRRAVRMASADVPALLSVEVGADGRLKGLEQATDGTGREERLETAVAITVHLLDLLVAFIGERLTLKLVRESWPDISLTPENESGD